jgi:hypothetical protein
LGDNESKNKSINKSLDLEKMEEKNCNLISPEVQLTIEFENWKKKIEASEVLRYS